jgi:hypothetical protein
MGKQLDVVIGPAEQSLQRGEVGSLGSRLVGRDRGLCRACAAGELSNFLEIFLEALRP